MNTRFAARCALVLVGLWPLIGSAQASETLPLSSLDLELMTTGWGKAQAKKSVIGTTLRIGEREFTEGVGTHAESEFDIDLGGRGQRFQAMVGADTASGNDLAVVEFVVSGDGKELWRSGLCKLDEAAKPCDVPLAGVKILKLLVTDGDNGMTFDYADWADAYITYTGEPPRAIPVPPEPAPPPEERVILTPPAPATPRMNGPKVYGVRPGSPFLYRIPVTGQRPMTYGAEGLPAGLQLDSATGIIAGRLTDRGEYQVELLARNDRGEARRPFRIVVGDKLALTPPMGWDNWYVHYNRVTDKTIRAAADAMISSGMADYGYQYVNTDDCWNVIRGSDDKEIGGEPRDPDGRLRPNKRFPDMQAMADYIHSKGLKAGIYGVPGPRTCAGYEGNYGHEAQDARSFAEWGFDLLKYDWCSYSEVAGGRSREHLIRPFKVMWEELQKQDRDIVVNICQYGMGNVWEWGHQYGHFWRTTGDLGLEGGRLSKGLYKVGLFNAKLADFAGPGGWNDPDYLLVGWVGDAAGMGEGRPTTLTVNEQYTQMSMWCLMAAPLIFSGDMTKLDPFTLNILCNHEVIEVDQDPLGKQGRIARRTDDALILVKEMEDGSKAIGLFNLSTAPLKITADWSTLGVSRNQLVRDLWRQKDLGVFKDSFQANVPRHGAAMLRMWAR